MAKMLNEGESMKKKSQWELLKREEVEDLLAQTGEIAMREAKINNTYIVYTKDGKMVKEYPDGKIVGIDRMIDEE